MQLSISSQQNQLKITDHFVMFLSLFLKDLRKHLIPIYEIKEKKGTYEWVEECQRSSDITKELLITLPVLHLLMATDKFRLECDTSKTAAEEALFQFL